MKSVKYIASFLFLCCSLFILSTNADAQTATPNPTKLTFTASPDHSLVVDTISILTRYDAVIFQGTTVVATVALGKPTPAATTNEIIVPFSGSALPRNTLLTAYVDSVGPYGSTRSTVSNPFVYVAAPRAASNPKMEP